MDCVSWYVRIHTFSFRRIDKEKEARGNISAAALKTSDARVDCIVYSYVIFMFTV